MWLNLTEKELDDYVPSTVRHCMIKVAKKFGGGKKGAKAAWNICRWSLTKNKYLKKPYRKDARPETIKDTQKGQKKHWQHSFEKEADKKEPKFMRVFRNLTWK